jgi:spermidine synthase
VAQDGPARQSRPWKAPRKDGRGGVDCLVRHAAFLAAGLLATAAQVLLLRELVVDAAGDEAAIGVGLAAWLVGIALGAAVARRRHLLAAPGDAAAGLLALALLPPLAILGGRLLRLALAPEAGELPGLGHVLAFSLATLAPPGLAVGWTFTALAASASRLWEAGEGIARLYVVESLGSLVGGVAVTVLAGAWLAPLRLSALLGALAALVALAAGREVLARRSWLGAALAVSAGLLAASPALDALSQRARFAGIAPGLPLRAVAETPYQHLALGGGDVLHLYASGQYAASFPDPYAAESLGHLLALLAPRPRQVLMIGGAERGLLPVLLRHPVEKLVLVEPDRAAFAFLVPWLPEADRAALGDPRVVTVHADPRGFLASPVGGTYDLVLLLSGEPATLLRARLATLEFFAAVASRLRPEGALVLPLRTAPLAITGETASLAGSLFRSVRLVLPVVRATPGPDTLLVAGGSVEAVTLDPAVLAARWQERGVVSSSFDPAVLPALLAPDRVAAQEAALQSAEATAEVSRDDRPISFLHALARRQQTTAGGWGRAVHAASRTPPGLLVALAFLPSLAFLGRILVGGPMPRAAAAAASHAVGVVGAAGMGWWLLVLFSFQTRAGALYGQLGALTAAFMLGLALGATLAPRAAFTRDERGAASLPGALRALRLSVAAAALFALALPFALAAAARASADGVGGALLGHGALLLAAGAATGGVFPVAAEVRLAAGDGPGDAAGHLEAADHVGAAAAALLGSALFVPLLGLTGTVWLLAGLVAVALGGTVASFARSGKGLGHRQHPGPKAKGRPR